MDLGALHLCVCNHVGKISKHMSRFFQWLQNHSFYENEKGSPPSLRNHGVRKRHTSPLRRSRNWRWDLIVPKKEALAYMKKLEAPQVSKQPDGLGLRTCSFFFKQIFLLRSNESSLLRGSSHMVTGYRFFWGGPIALHGLVHFLNTTGPSLTKVVYAYFDRSSYVLYIYVYTCVYTCVYTYIYNYIYMLICIHSYIYSEHM